MCFMTFFLACFWVEKVALGDATWREAFDREVDSQTCSFLKNMHYDEVIV